MSDRVTISPFSRVMIPRFLELSGQEGWVSDPWELEFLLSTSARGCFCAVEESGAAIGFVTSIRHTRSGWIGNLIVAERYRGRGVGNMLFQRALQELCAMGARTVWLTASAMGKKLYERQGFRRIDSIQRWCSSPPRTRLIRPGSRERSERTSRAARTSLDCLGWGDRRSALLKATVERGEVMELNRGFVAIQPVGDGILLGPFAARDAATAGRLLEQALTTALPGKKIYLDTPVTNRLARRLLTVKNLDVIGCTELMYVGMRPDYRPEHIYGLATMGSCG